MNAYCHLYQLYNTKPLNHQFYGLVSYTYPMIILDVDISSLLNKEFHCVATAFASYNVQSSLLVEKMTET